MKETELAEKVVDWLKCQYWEVYQEVQLHPLGPIADIVAVSGKLLWIIECKMGFSLVLLDQIIRWRGYGNFLSVAVPSKHCGKRYANLFLKNFGIGLLNVSKYDIYEFLHPCLVRRRSDKMINSLNESHKTFAKAGNSDGKHWTPFQQTCLELQRFVIANPSVYLKDAMGKIKHHYSSNISARTSIGRYLSSGKNIVKGVYCVFDKGKIRLYPEGFPRRGRK